MQYSLNCYLDSR